MYTIQQRELVFQLNPKYDKLIGRPAGNGINDITLKGFTSVNNYPKASAFSIFSNTRDFNVAAILQQTVKFIGVAVLPIDYLNTNQKDMTAVQIGGSCTIWNTGDHIIRPGQLLIWAWPKDPKLTNNNGKRIHGQPLSKHHFSVVPLEAALEDQSSNQYYDFASYLHSVHCHVGAPPTGASDESKSLRKSLDAFTAAFDADGTDIDGMKKGLKDYTRKTIMIYEEIRTRVFAKALSGGAPGEQIDVMLCSGH